MAWPNDRRRIHLSRPIIVSSERSVQVSGSAGARCGLIRPPGLRVSEVKMAPRKPKARPRATRSTLVACAALSLCALLVYMRRRAGGRQLRGTVLLVALRAVSRGCGSVSVPQSVRIVTAPSCLCLDVNWHWAFATILAGFAVPEAPATAGTAAGTANPRIPRTVHQIMGLYDDWHRPQVRDARGTVVERSSPLTTSRNVQHETHQ